MSEVEKQFQVKNAVESFEFQPKDAVLVMTLSGLSLDKIKEPAKLKNINYRKYMRTTLEKNKQKRGGLIV